MRLEGEAFHRIERELSSRIIFLGIVDCNIDDTFDLEFRDLSVSIDIAVDLFFYFNYHIFKERIHGNSLSFCFLNSSSCESILRLGRE
jgi:hypothetical protein